MPQMVDGEGTKVIGRSTGNTWECIGMHPITADSRERAEAEGALAAISEGEKKVCFTSQSAVHRSSG